MLEAMMRSVGEARPRVLGLDIDDRKLRICNAGAVEPKCGFMDLSRLEPESKPLVKGVVAIDVFEHINEPVSPASGNEAVWPRAVFKCCDGRLDARKATGLTFQAWKWRQNCS